MNISYFVLFQKDNSYAAHTHIYFELRVSSSNSDQLCFVHFTLMTLEKASIYLFFSYGLNKQGKLSSLDLRGSESRRATINSKPPCRRIGSIRLSCSSELWDSARILKIGFYFRNLVSFTLDCTYLSNVFKINFSETIIFYL